MIQALVGLKQISKAVGGSVEDAIQDFAGVQKSWDSCMKGYNASLGVYSACAAVLDVLDAELVQLEANCSTLQPAPDTCKNMIADLRQKIVSQVLSLARFLSLTLTRAFSHTHACTHPLQNATCVQAWATAASRQEKLLQAEAEVRTSNTEMAKATQIAQRAYAGACEGGGEREERERRRGRGGEEEKWRYAHSTNRLCQ